MVAATLLAGLLGCESTPVVLYHHVGEQADGARWVSVEQLEAHLDHLVETGHTALSVGEWERVRGGEAPRPERPVVLSFDDGYRNFYRFAYPALRARGLRATLFVITGRVAERAADRQHDEVEYLVWPELRELHEHGIELAAHTVTHPRLDTLSEAEVRAELAGSKRDLEAHLGVPVTVLAYPFGVSSPLVRRVAEEVGFEAAYSVGVGADGRFQRLRTSMHADDDVDAFDRAIGRIWWAHLVRGGR